MVEKTRCNLGPTGLTLANDIAELAFEGQVFYEGSAVDQLVYTATMTYLERA